MNSICELLGSKYPVIQGAMGVICNPEFVSAISESGGFGLLATAYQRDPNDLADQIIKTKALTQKPFGVNLTIRNPCSEKLSEVIAASGVGTVTTSAGSPERAVSLFRPKGIKVLHVCPSVKTALKAEKAGVDAIIAEGGESGGLQGFNSVSTLVLVPAIADRVKIPVVAAGGIADSRGFQAALKLGAKGVQVGTRFIASIECGAHNTYKQNVCAHDESETVLVDRRGARVRALPTRLALKTIENREEAEALAVPENVSRAWIDGDLDAYLLTAGQAVGLINEIKPVKEIIEEMVSGFRST